MTTTMTWARALATAALLATLPAQAVQFTLPLAGLDIKGALDTTLTVGAAMRTQSQNVNLIGKSDNNPNVCAFPNQSCQGVFRDQYFPAAALQKTPGQYGMYGDDGDLNYNKGDLISAVGKVTPTLKLSLGKFGFFGRLLYFYDGINNNFTEYHPNEITPQNKNQVGATDHGPLIMYPSTVRVYGPGGVVRNQRNDGQTLAEVGTNLQYLDSYVYGSVPVLGHDLSFKLGRQTLNWGESTTIVFDSINSINPINANNFYRVGQSLSEVFTPVNMFSMSFSPFSDATVEAYYQLEWQNTQSAPPGSYFSTADLGTNNTGRFANLSFGGSADDPYNVGTPLDNPLSKITSTTAYAARAPDRNPRGSGQYGLKLDYYAEDFNNGTDLSLYYEHYHSRLPYVSFTSINQGCAKNATSVAEFYQDCPNLPGANLLNPAAATSDAVPLNTGNVFLEYPEDIDLLGFSFNTTLGNYALQGEVSYQPNKPMQVSIADLEFAAAQPALTNCGQNGITCDPASAGVGYDRNGNVIPYANSSALDANGNPIIPGGQDTIDLGVGTVPGSARAFPSYVVAYRGMQEGFVPPNSYIRGYQRFQLLQFDLGFTRVLGATDNWIGADQVILVGEGGADYIPDLPALDVLQIQGPATFLSATAGADGSGANGSRQACATVVDCSVGPDGLRFNPHQQDLSGFVDPLSWGYRLVALINYENVLSNIGLHPFILFQHDVQGTSPGPAYNFVAGRKQLNVLIEARYRSALSFTVGYTWFWGGGVQNLLIDRDYLQAFAKYEF